MTDPTFAVVFSILDKDAHQTATVIDYEATERDPARTYVSLRDVKRDESVMMTLDDFRRMVATVEQAVS